MRKHHSALGGVALALALTLTGCGGDDTKPEVQESPSQSPAPTPTSTPAPKSPEEQAAAALERYLEYRDRTYRRPESFDTEDLARFATGDEYLQFQAYVLDLKNFQIVVTGKYGHELDSPRRRGETYVVRDCEDRDAVTETKDDKEVPPPVGPNGEALPNPLPVEYELVTQRDQWLVQRSDILWEEQC